MAHMSSKDDSGPPTFGLSSSYPRAIPPSLCFSNCTSKACVRKLPCLHKTCINIIKRELNFIPHKFTVTSTLNLSLSIISFSLDLEHHWNHNITTKNRHSTTVFPHCFAAILSHHHYHDIFLFDAFVRNSQGPRTSFFFFFVCSLCFVRISFFDQEAIKTPNFHWTFISLNWTFVRIFFLFVCNHRNKSFFYSMHSIVITR